LYNLYTILKILRIIRHYSHTHSNLPIIPQTGNGLSFQILCGGEGFTKESKMPYAPKGKYVFDTLHLWVL